MVTKSGSRRLLAASLVVLGGLAAPSLVGAQGLLPNLGTRYREKPSCASEPPFYATVRHQYFGYYPTCWRRFPPGWTCPCPNPELPNFQQALQDRKLRVDEGGPADRPGDAGADAGADGDVPRPEPMDLPETPNGDSPFRQPDTKPATPPPLQGDDSLDSEPRRNPARGSQDRPSTSSLMTSPPVQVAAAPVQATAADLPSTAAAAPSMAPLVEADGSTTDPTPLPPPAEARPIAAPVVDEAPSLSSPEASVVATAPMPATPEPTIPLGVDPRTGNGTADPAIAPPSIVESVPAPATAPRRGLLGGVFNRFRRR